MAQSIAKLVRYAGGRDVWGGHGVFFANYTGPASYVNSGVFSTSGEIIDSIGALTELGAANTPLRGIDSIPEVQTVSGTYYIKFLPSSTGPCKRWFAHWFTTSWVEVTNATVLSAESAIVMIIGG
jgi:hypothetical protein